METLLITSRELGLLIALVSKLDPERYKDDEIKVLIYKAKATAGNASFDRVRLVS
jgi:hypothetical protein